MMQPLTMMDHNPYQSPAPEPVEDDGRLQSFRLSRDFKYAAEYRSALLVGILWQLVLFVPTQLLVDDGRVQAAYWLALVVQWAATAFILTLAPQTTSSLGVSFIRYGMLLLVIVSLLVAPHLPPPLVPSDASL